MNPVIEFLVASLILLGAVFALLGSVGLARLPDFFTRLHGPTKATTLGVGAMALASAVYFTATQPGLSLHEIAGWCSCSSPRRCPHICWPRRLYTGA